jgi:DNA-binding CsgD family transcriptional regulator
MSCPLAEELYKLVDKGSLTCPLFEPNKNNIICGKIWRICWQNDRQFLPNTFVRGQTNHVDQEVHQEELLPEAPRQQASISRSLHSTKTLTSYAPPSKISEELLPNRRAHQALPDSLVANHAPEEQPRKKEEPIHLPARLSLRETEVLQLVAQGKSNREIAEDLVISERTVANHLASIFNKTGVENRAAAAAFAIRHQLAE